VFSACAAHTPYISKPSSEASKQQWLGYYEVQFKAYGDSVLPPPDDAPEVARQAYTEAKAKWQKEQMMKGLKLGVVAGLGAIAVGIIGGLIVAEMTY